MRLRSVRLPRMSVQVEEDKYHKTGIQVFPKHSSAMIHQKNVGVCQLTTRLSQRNNDDFLIANKGGTGPVHVDTDRLSIIAAYVQFLVDHESTNRPP